MPQPQSNQALLAGFLCYVMWGMFPLFWALLDSANPIEILAQRIVWSLLAVLLTMLVVRQGWAWVRPAMAGGGWKRLLAASLLIAVNWGMFIYAVNSNHVVEASLGYFINPMVNLALGWLVFKERLDRAGKIGVGFALAGVIVVSAGSWQTVYISLVLALSFGLYGLVKKQSPLPALPGLLVESAFLMLPSLAYLIWLGGRGAGQFAVNAQLTWLFIISGVVTAIPLWLFAIAAKGLPMGTLGFLQYVGPTLQFLTAVLIFRQHVSLAWWLGLTLVWIGCAFYLSGVWRGSRREAPASAPG